mmetsp:Transcript_17580/g.17412  ORF Transcript_17580/g.17412 Transcript_17580/m.17412 type:complete len:92 (-) Transcript_17580:32-307(-)
MVVVEEDMGVLIIIMVAATVATALEGAVMMTTMEAEVVVVDIEMSMDVMIVGVLGGVRGVTVAIGARGVFGWSSLEVLMLPEMMIVDYDYL